VAGASIFAALACQLQGRNAVNPADDQTALNAGAFSGEVADFSGSKARQSKAVSELGPEPSSGPFHEFKETRHADPRHRLG